MMDKIYTVPQAMKILKISDSTLRRIIKLGDLETIRIGSRLLIKETALVKLIERKRIFTGSGPNDDQLR